MRFCSYMAFVNLERCGAILQTPCLTNTVYFVLTYLDLGILQ